jgi:hypothetical protein
VYSSDYTALSYTWGASTPTQEIWVQSERRRGIGGMLHVGHNLFDFLVAYMTHPWGRRGQDFRPLWIDQICIDQSCQSERSSQVGIMNKIYKRAKNVLVWLGCEAAMVEAARQVRDNKNLDNCALVTILHHPYFTRIWIIQEVALGSNITFVCGDVEFTWQCIKDTILRSQASAVGDKYQSALTVILGSQRSHTLQECFIRYCQNHCRDPRDKVYGLLGLTPERWRLRVDYTKKLVEVYLDAVAALFEELFDIHDPGCFYPQSVQDTSDSFIYQNTMLHLGRAMGLPEHQLGGLLPFLRVIGEIYMGARVRNVQFQLPASDPARNAHHGALRKPAKNWWPRWSGLSGLRSDTSSTQMVTATRRNPLVRDVIPTLGLRLAQTSPLAGKTDDDHGGPRWDRWWFSHNGNTRYFECAYV